MVTQCTTQNFATLFWVIPDIQLSPVLTLSKMLWPTSTHCRRYLQADTRFCCCSSAKPSGQVSIDFFIIIHNGVDCHLININMICDHAHTTDCLNSALHTEVYTMLLILSLMTVQCRACPPYSLGYLQRVCVT